jgi:preprotein translocase subunit SecG
METVFIVIHLMVIVAMVAMVLLQRSEGGALGIGGGGGFMASRGQGNVLTRSTAILAAVFFGTSIVLSILAQMNAPPSAILDEVPAVAPPVETDTVPGTGQGILDTLEGISQPGQTPPAAPGASGDGTSIPTTPIVPSAPAEPQVPTSQ